MEAVMVVIVTAVMFFIGGIIFGRRHATKIQAKLDEANTDLANAKTWIDQHIPK